MSTFRLIVTLMPKLLAYIICTGVRFHGLWVAANKSTGKWFCARTLAEKCKYTDRNQIINSSEGWTGTVTLEMLLNKKLIVIE